MVAGMVSLPIFPFFPRFLPSFPLSFCFSVSIFFSSFAFFPVPIVSSFLVFFFFF